MLPFGISTGGPIASQSGSWTGSRIGAHAGDLGRGWLDPPATASGTTATDPAATEAIVTPSLGETSSFWLQSADPGPGPSSVSFDFGLHRAGETAQSPPVATTPGSTASGPGAPFLTSLRLDDDFAVGRLRNEPAAPSTASATGWAESWLTEIDPFSGTGEGASPPASLAPPAAAGHTVAGAEAPPTAADSWRIRPPGMSGEPHPVAFDPWSAPPGPSGQVVYTEANRTAVMSTGAPPGGQATETPGFGRAASGAVELPFSRRDAIVRRFGTENAVLEAEVALRTGDADALGWSAGRRREVLADIYRLSTIAQLNLMSAAEMIDVDWRSIEALGLFLEAHPPSP